MTIPLEIATKQAYIVASYIYRDYWIARGTPPIERFFHNLNDSEKFNCFRIAHEVTTALKIYI